ncbi:MAG: zinc ribbon domain-containing protein [Clostridium sp.]|nr:zinc ribbon domain-containing protein [Clostridium sp.]
MDDRVKELMDRILETASVAADAATDTVRVAGRKAGQMVDVAKLNVQLFDLNGELSEVLRELGQLMYNAHLGQGSNGDAVDALLSRADDLSDRIAEIKTRIAALRHSQTCPYCGAACGKEDKFCRVCGREL